MAMEEVETALLHGTLQGTIYEVDKIHSSTFLDTKSGTLAQKVARTILFQMKRLCICDTQFTGNRLYATVDLDQVRLGRTRPVRNATHPKWREDFNLYCAHKAAFVVFTVKDDNAIGATLIGRARVPVRDILQGRKLTKFIDIVDEKWHPIGSRIHVSLQFSSVSHDDNWSQGIKTQRLDLVPRTFFKQRQGCRVTLYHDVHVEDSFAHSFERWTGVPYEPHRCWKDMFEAINNAKYLIYIAGWSVYHDLHMIRDSQNRNPQSIPPSLGQLLKAKADQNVRVLILVWDDRTSSEILKKDGIMATHDEETFEFFKNSRVNCVKCPRSSAGAQSILQGYEIDAMFTHHQKTLVVDAEIPGRRRTIISFVGGIDLCDGRYDTQEHPLFRTLKTTHRLDFHQPNFEGATIEKGGPREPWHDIHSRIEGPAAWDVLYNFEQRWEQQVKSSNKPGILNMDELYAIDPSPTEAVAESNDTHTWNVQIFRSIDSGAAFGHVKADPERAAAAGLIFEKDNLVERSIQDAYICAIRRAKNFIYIENQYFLGSSFGWNPKDDIKLDDVGALHLIPKELSLKIVSSIKAGKRLSVYVVVPMWPEGPPESETVQAILDWQRRTMEMMYTDIAKAIQETNLNTRPTDYLSFFCLGNKERRGPEEDYIKEPPPADSDYARAQHSRRFMVYVHAKTMIVDDEYIIVGSANINQRSMDGERDTEIAMGAYQPHHLTTSESPSKGEVFRFRMSLWYEHLRQFHPLFGKPETMACMHEVNRLAKENWDLYVDDSYEEDLPRHLLPYPIIFDMGGNQEWGIVRGTLQFFPDTKATVVGEKARILPPILTT